MKPLNPNSLKKIVMVLLFAMFIGCTLFFQNCGSSVHTPSDESMHGEEAP